MAQTQFSQAVRDKLKAVLDSPWSRLCNLYWQVDKYGERFKFSPNPVQEELYKTMWFLNLILKARQQGVTTVIQMFLLDRCLFNCDVKAGVIAHNRDDAENFFKWKIKYAYDHLPEMLKAEITASTDRVGELQFSNGSSIRVGTSMRSDTLQYLHISEFGKICAKNPEKAAEIVSGSLNTVVPGQFIFIESTAEGAFGKFYDMCQVAEKKMLAGEELTVMDYKFFFFAWYLAQEYRLDMPTPAPVPPELAVYFEQLEEEHGIVLDRAQKNWYVKKKEEQGEFMQREYPSTPGDAFRAVVEGAVFGKQMRKARQDRRVLKTIPYVECIPVNTFWDLGRGDHMVIWFHQRVGPENRFFDFIMDHGHNLQHYIDILLNQKPYVYGKHYMPHDIEVTSLDSPENKTRKETAEAAGLRNIVVVPRIAEKEEAHQAGRAALSTCYFSEDGCKYTPPESVRDVTYSGIASLENYRYEYDERRQDYSKKPVENIHCHPADAFMQFAQAYNPNVSSSSGGGVASGMF